MTQQEIIEQVTPIWIDFRDKLSKLPITYSVKRNLEEDMPEYTIVIEFIESEG